MLRALLYLGIAAQAIALPGVMLTNSEIYETRKTFTQPHEKYVLPSDEKHSATRSLAVKYKYQNFLYGKSPVGDVAYYPTGPLGKPMADQEVKDFYADIQPFQEAVLRDAKLAATAAAQRGLKTLADYEALYIGQWNESLPEGVDPGMLSNYTDDRLFAMERLSTSPFILARLNPAEPLPFAINESIAPALSGKDMDTLHQEGRLFYINWQSQNELPKLPDRYAAACDAYFYIHPNSTFLPLAIRTNTTTELIYSPLDTYEDWLLAKMMFNVADLWGSQFYHLVNTHDLAEIIYESAIRTLDDRHPILAILKRLNLQAFAMRQGAANNLTNPGGAVDQLFPHPGSVVATYASVFYKDGGAGAVRGNYLDTQVQTRGLVNCTYGPELAHFPFYEDARVISDEIRIFINSFVESYYPTQADITKDQELVNWLKEAAPDGPAGIIDFPTTDTLNATTLVDLLSFVAYLVGVSHQVQNTNDPVGSIASLPFHPAAFWKELPTTKGVTDVVSYLPPLEQCIGQITLMAGFGRAKWFGTNRTLTHMFDDEAMLGRMNDKTADAARKFQSAMEDFSKVVSARTFGPDGLSQGMPFVWKVLDPNEATYYLTI
ncbi:MAG: hypothetical protein M1838_002097 [Thelocarpon superellum]|nr:MAG: hypothetical protein M1838_002097 [Thelocarpon superellum]